MAKVTYTDLMGDYNRLQYIYVDGSITLTDAVNDKSAIFSDNSGHQVIFKGQGFTYDGQTTMTGGQINEIVFQNDQKQLLADVEGHFNAKQFANLLLSPEQGVTHMLEKMLKGDDTITGSKIINELDGYAGNDILSGGKGGDEFSGGVGADTMTGGGGADRFVFLKGDGKDVITDFDADGGTGKQDLIAILGENIAGVTIKSAHHGDDTLVDLHHGDTVLLLGVKASHVTTADFDALG